MDKVVERFVANRNVAPRFVEPSREVVCACTCLGRWTGSNRWTGSDRWTGSNRWTGSHRWTRSHSIGTSGLFWCGSSASHRRCSGNTWDNILAWGVKIYSRMGMPICRAHGYTGTWVHRHAGIWARRYMGRIRGILTGHKK